MIRITDKQLEALLLDRRFNVSDPHEPWESCPDCQIRYALLELSAIRAKRDAICAWCLIRMMKRPTS